MEISLQQLADAAGITPEAAQRHIQLAKPDYRGEPIDSIMARDLRHPLGKFSIGHGLGIAKSCAIQRALGSIAAPFPNQFAPQAYQSQSISTSAERHEHMQDNTGIESQARATWQRDANLRAEFGDDFDRYLAYEKATAKGHVRIVNRTVQQGGADR